MKTKTNYIIRLITLAASFVLVATQMTGAMAAGQAMLELSTSKNEVSQGETFTVEVDLKNPGAQQVISVRSWLEYDNKALEAVSIKTQESAFNLAAPGEDEIDEIESRIKIGRSNISGGVSSAEAKVATIEFKVISGNKQSTDIKFYDYQSSELGHTSVNIIDGGFPLNILKGEPEKLTLSLNPAGTASGSSSASAVEEPVVDNTNNQPAVVFNPADLGVIPTTQLPVVLVRPTDLKVNTGPGYADLKWEAGADINRQGFHVYYGNTSGNYSRRRTISNNNQYRLEGLTEGETYYFAVTAYDVNGGESDYSNEAAIILGQPLSATHPFEGVLQANYQRIPMQPQNGPFMGWLALSAAGLSGAVVYKKKK